MHEDAALAIGAGLGCMGGLMMTVADMDLDVMAFESGFAGSVVGYGMPSVFGGWSACYCFWYSGQAGSGGRPAFALAPIPMLVSLWVAFRYRWYHHRGKADATGASILDNVRLELRLTTLLSAWACLGILAQGVHSQMRIDHAVSLGAECRNVQ